MSLQTIGERLETARKKMGISLREAAEGTKIRTDFLAKIEDDSMEIPLPEVYRRGFVKCYGNYLEVDTEKLMADYDAAKGQNPERTRVAGRKDAHEVLGRMDLSSRDSASREATKAPPSQPATGQEPVHAGTVSEFDDPENQLERSGRDHSRLLKIGLLAVGSGLLLVLVILWLVSLAGGGEPANDGGAASTIATAPERIVPIPLTIRATDDGTHVTVRQLNDGRQLFSGTLAAGESADLERLGPVQIYLTDLQYFEYSDDSGEFTRIDGEGIGRITIE